MSYLGFCPPGVIFPYAAATPPAGWLLCDGAAVSRTTYAALFAIIGGSWGTGNGSTTFHLPDFRGRFLRGVDGAAGRDPNSGTRTAANSGGNTGNAVGSVQANATAVNGLLNASSALTATAAAQAWTYGAASGTAAAQAWTYGAASGTAAAQVWGQIGSGTAAAQIWTYGVASGTAAAQAWTYGAASGTAAAQAWTYGAASGTAAGQTLSVAAVALASGLATTIDLSHTHGVGALVNAPSLVTGVTGSNTGNSIASSGSHGHPGSNTPIQLSGSNAGNTASASAGNGTGGTTNFGVNIGGTGDHTHSVPAQVWAYDASSGTAAAQAISGSTAGASVSLNHTHPVTGTTSINHTHVSSSVTGVTGTNGTSSVTGVTGTNSTSAVTGVTGTNATSAVTGVTGTNATSAVTGVTGTNATSAVSGTAAAQALSGDAETRPLNANVNYIIKT